MHRSPRGSARSISRPGPWAASILLLLSVAGGCARRQDALFGDRPVDERVYALSEVQDPPVLRGCTRYTDPDTSPDRRLSVTVRFVVRRDGTVDPASAAATGGTSGRPDRVNEAGVEAARSCVFTPARHDGAPVAVRMARTFSFVY